MENWQVVQRNKETGEEKTFLDDVEWNTSKETAEKCAELRWMIVSVERYPTLKTWDILYYLQAED